jgi:hypothetical protein
MAECATLSRRGRCSLAAVKLIIDPWIDHLRDRPIGRNPDTLVHIYLGLYTHEVGWLYNMY